MALLEAMLQFNPALRISPAQALEHPYFKEVRGPRTASDAPQNPGMSLPANHLRAGCAWQILIVRQSHRSSHKLCFTGG